MANKIKHNSELKFLRFREDDPLYMDKILDLIAEKNKLLSKIYNSITLTKSPIEKTSNSKILPKVLIWAIAVFTLGLFVIIIQGALRAKEA